MPIRVQCDKCGSVMKIREDKVGTELHCPKCHVKFLVRAEAALPEEPGDKIDSGVLKKSPLPAAPSSSKTPLAAPRIEPPSEDFDPVSFLTGGAASGKLQPAAAKTREAPPEGKGGKSSPRKPAADDFDPSDILMPDRPPAKKAPPPAAPPPASPPPEPVAPAAAPLEDFEVFEMLMEGNAAKAPAAAPPPPAAGAETPAPRPGSLDSKPGPMRRWPLRGVTEPPREGPDDRSDAAKMADNLLRGPNAPPPKSKAGEVIPDAPVVSTYVAEEPKAPIEWGKLGRSFALKGGPALLAFAMVAAGVFFFTRRMWGGLPQWPEVAEVSGTVTKGGRPLGGAQVVFTPLDVDATSAMAVTSESGGYRLSLFENHAGAVIGKNRVEVSKLADNGRELVPPRTPYSVGTGKVETVAESGGTIDIKIP